MGILNRDLLISPNGLSQCFENEEGMSLFLFFIDLGKRVFPKFGNLGRLQSGWCMGA